MSILFNIPDLQPNSLSSESRVQFRQVGASNHTDSYRANQDYYATDPIAITKLLAVETFSNYIWEPAVGGGHLTEALKAVGKDVRCSDIIDRGYGGTEVLNFLSALPSDIDRTRDIITNPPYNLVQEFVEKSLNLVETGSKVAMFLRVLFLESQRRKFLFEQNPPKTVYICSSRISCAKNGDFEKYPSSVTAYAWFVWEKGFRGDTILKWI